MKRTKLCLATVSSFALCLFLAFPSWAEVEVGDYTLSGSMEIGGLVGHRSGDDAKFNEYRQAEPNNYIVPELQLLLGSKKEDFYMSFDAQKPGYNDQNYRLRFGSYGLVDIEAEWDQIPHLFSEGVAKTPYSRNDGNYTLGSRPGTFTATSSCTTSPICQWLNANAKPIDLGLLYGIGRFKIRYTPMPGWTFSGSYWSQHVDGDRAFGGLFGTSPGAYNITELPEPIDYQMHNVEVGGEYAGNGWSVGLKYNASLFHNNISTLLWDNPIHATVPLGGTGDCVDSKTYSNSLGSGPCRGRLDLYPDNQAHTITLSAGAKLPLKTRFMGTASYGWRFQDDSFLPVTDNSCYFGGTTKPINCTTAASALPRPSRGSLNGDIRPTMINGTLVNNLVEHLNLKAYYRLYDFDNRTDPVHFPAGIIINDSSAAPTEVGSRTFPFSYSRQNVGADAGYEFTRWLTAKVAYGWERMHRQVLDVQTSDEHTVGPTIDVKPNPSLLFRASYRHSRRNAPDYNNNRAEDDIDLANISRKFFLAKRDRDKSSLFMEVTPWEKLSLHAGFEFTSERYLDAILGVQNDVNYSPSIGFIYAPLDWLKFFGDYNWDRYSWKLDAMQRSSTTQNPEDPATCDANCQLRKWTSKGLDLVHTVSIGSDMDLIPHVLGFRIQYGFSNGSSAVRASGATCVPQAPAAGGCTKATDYPTISNSWHELLARFEYQIHKNVALKLGYYFNHAVDKDVGVDIMKPWMGDVIDPTQSAGGLANLQRSIFLGDKVKGPFTAHIGFIALKFSF